MATKDSATALTAHLGEQGWRSSRCAWCSMNFLTLSDRTDCGSTSCARPGRTIENSRAPIFWEDVWPALAKSFVTHGFTTTYRSDLVNHVGHTRFVGAGLQIFESAMYEGAAMPQGRLFVPQPVIRLNYLDALAQSDGYSTAFVNVCTEQASAAFDDYVAHVKAWLDCLAALKVPGRDVTLVRRSRSWTGGPFRGHALVVLVSDVEVGDIVFIDRGAPETQPLLPIVDTSFGLERLVSALNTTRMTYSGLLGPLPLSTMPELRIPLDRLRTATLMMMAGLEPAGRGRGRLLRELATVELTGSPSTDIEVVVAHAYDYWSTFLTPQVTLQHCQAMVRTERERHSNRRLLEAVGWRRAATTLAARPSHQVSRHLLQSGLTENELAAGAAQAQSPVWRPVSAARRPAVYPRSTLTIISPTSPIPAHPSTVFIERGVRSLVRHAGLAECRHLIVCDGNPHPRSPTADTYEDYKQRLRALIAVGGLSTRAEMIELDRCEGLGGVMNAAVSQVDTPYLLTWEHDWLLTRRLDTSAVLGVFADEDVHYVRLNKRRTREAGWDSVLKPDERERGIALVRTGCWSANPHFARTAHYRRMVMPHVQIQLSGGSEGFEHPVFRAYQSDIHRFGFDRAQHKWGVFIYGRMGDGPVVAHLDGRGSLGERTSDI